MSAHGGYLLDTSVLSGLAPGKPPLRMEMAEWLRFNSERLFVPCIAIAELEQCICRLRRSGGARRADALSRWLEGLVTNYANRVLPLDAQACRVAGQIADRAVAAGRHPGFPDVAIAALARQHSLLLLTRNLRHFTALRMTAANPFERLPE